MPPLELDTDRPRIALVRLSSVGDLVRVLPVVASLRARWPECELTWVVEASLHGLVAGHPMVDRFVLLRRELGPAAHPELWWKTRGLSFDLVLDLHRYFKAGLVTGLLDAPVKLGFDRARSADLNWWFTTHRIPPAPRRHVQDEYCEFLEHLGVPVVRAWPLPPGEEMRRRPAGTGGAGGLLGVHTTSSAEEKDWPVERWARTLEAARRDLGLRPVLVGGRSPREDRRARRLQEFVEGDPVEDRRAQDLRRLVRTAGACTVFTGPDSGPLHVAAAAGVPAVGLYGCTDPARHGPRGPVEALDELVVDRFGPRPDGEPTDETRPGRMSRITVEEVVGRIERAREVARSVGAGRAADGERP
jgi:heptosyltransferase I